jgi:hypothetical protein
MARRGMHFKFNLGRTKGRGHKQPSSGGGAEWLPLAPSGDAALAYADFVNGHYYANGAEVSLADIVADPTMRTSSGFVVAGGGPVGQFIGPLLTQLLLPAKTVQLKVTRSAPLVNDPLVLVVQNEDDSNELLFASLQSAQYYGDVNSASVSISETPDVPSNHVAVTHSGTRIAAAWNGGSIHVATSAEASPVATRAISGAFGTGGTVFVDGGFIITEMAVFPSQNDAGTVTLAT